MTNEEENEEMKTMSTEMKRQRWHVRQGEIKTRLEIRKIMRKQGGQT